MIGLILQRIKYILFKLCYMFKHKLLFIGILSGGVVTTYPNFTTFLKLIICVMVGIGIWYAISRPIKKRSIKEKISDYLGQIVLAVVSAYIIRKYIHLEGDFEFLLAGFVAGLLSNGILLLYRWLVSPMFLDILKRKIKDKLK